MEVLSDEQELELAISCGDGAAASTAICQMARGKDRFSRSERELTTLALERACARIRHEQRSTSHGCVRLGTILDQVIADAALRSC